MLCTQRNFPGSRDQKVNTNLTQAMLSVRTVRSIIKYIKIAVEKTLGHPVTTEYTDAAMAVTTPARGYL